MAGSSEQLVSAALDVIYDAAAVPALWPQALQRMADCLGDVGAVLLWQRDDGAFGVIASPSLAEAQRDYIEHGWNQRDLRAIRAVERSLWLRTDAVTDLDAVEPHEMDTHPIYTEFLARHGLRWACALGLQPSPNVVVAISIQRAAGKTCFSDEEKKIATWLGRHAERSLRLTIRLLDAEVTERGLLDSLARCDIGVFILDSLGRVIHANGIAETHLGSVFQVRQGRLRVSGPQNQRCELALDAVLAGASSASLDNGPIVLKRVDSDQLLAAYLLPLNLGNGGNYDDFLLRARAIVLLVEAKPGTAPDPAVVRDLLGLTLGEARLAALVGAGLSPRSAGEKLGITEDSARTVLKRVFQKTGVSRQSELSALLAKLVLR